MRHQIEFVSCLIILCQPSTEYPPPISSFFCSAVSHGFIFLWSFPQIFLTPTKRNIHHKVATHPQLKLKNKFKFKSIPLHFLRYISTTWNQKQHSIQHHLNLSEFILHQQYLTCVYATSVQPEIVTDNIILCYTHSTWFSLNSWKMISGVYTCTIWNLCLRYHRKLHSHKLIFTTFLQLAGFITYAI